MKNFKELYEGILADVEDTIQSGDRLFEKAEKEFLDLQKYLTNPRFPIKGTYKSRVEWRYGFNVENLCKLIGSYGFDKLSYVSTVTYKYKPSGNWEFMLYFTVDNRYGVNSNARMATLKASSTKYKTYPEFVKGELVPLFKDMNTFIEFIKKQQVER